MSLILDDKLEATNCDIQIKTSEGLSYISIGKDWGVWYKRINE